MIRRTNTAESLSAFAFAVALLIGLLFLAMWLLS